MNYEFTKNFSFPFKTANRYLSTAAFDKTWTFCICTHVFIVKYISWFSWLYSLLTAYKLFCWRGNGIVKCVYQQLCHNDRHFIYFHHWKYFLHFKKFFNSYEYAYSYQSMYSTVMHHHMVMENNFFIFAYIEINVIDHESKAICVYIKMKLKVGNSISIQISNNLYHILL